MLAGLCEHDDFDEAAGQVFLDFALAVVLGKISFFTTSSAPSSLSVDLFKCLPFKRCHADLIFCLMFMLFSVYGFVLLVFAVQPDIIRL